MVQTIVRTMELVWSESNFISLPEEINHQQTTTTSITTMAASTRNGPLPPHTRYNFECLHVRSIGDNHQTSKYAFIWGWEDLWPSKRSNDEAMMAMNLASPLEHFEGHLPSYCKRKVYLLAWGVVSYQSNALAWGELPSVCC